MEITAGRRKYALQFNTDDRDLYKLVEKTCQLAMDQEKLAKLRKENRALMEFDRLYIKPDEGVECEPSCSSCENSDWDMPQCKGECQKRGYKWYREAKHE